MLAETYKVLQILPRGKDGHLCWGIGEDFPEEEACEFTLERWVKRWEETLKQRESYKQKAGKYMKWRSGNTVQHIKYTQKPAGAEWSQTPAGRVLVTKTEFRHCSADPGRLPHVLGQENQGCS